MGEKPSTTFFKVEVNLPLKYLSIIPMVAMAESKTTEELVKQIILNDSRVIAKTEWFDKLPPEPKDFGVVPRSSTRVLGDTKK